MADKQKPQEMSQRELDEYIDELIEAGQEDTPEFARAYKVWARMNGEDE